MTGLLIILVAIVCGWMGFFFGHGVGHIHERQQHCDHEDWDELREGFEHCNNCHAIRRTND